jgi:hypothetical protein
LCPFRFAPIPHERSFFAEAGGSTETFLYGVSPSALLQSFITV